MSFFMTLWLVHGMTNVATLKSLIRSVFVLCKIVVLIIVGPHLTIYKLITYNARVYNSFRPNLFIKMLQLYHFASNLIFKFHSPRGHNSKDFLYWFLYRKSLLILIRLTICFVLRCILICDVFYRLPVEKMSTFWSSYIFYYNVSKGLKGTRKGCGLQIGGCS